MNLWSWKCVACTIKHTYGKQIFIYLISINGLPSYSVLKNLPANAGDAGDTGSISGSGRSPGGGNGNHSSILAGKIPARIEEPDGLQSMGSV